MRIAFAILVGLALLVMPAAAGAQSGAVLETQLLYETVEIPAGKELQFKVRCPPISAAGKWEVSEGRVHVVEGGDTSPVWQRLSARTDDRTWTFRLLNGTTDKAIRVTVVVTCRRVKVTPRFKIVRPAKKRFTAAGNWYVNLVPGRLAVIYLPCPTKAKPPALPGGAAPAVPPDAKPAPKAKFKFVPGRSDFRGGGLGEYFFDIEPEDDRRARSAAVASPVPRVIAREPIDGGYKVAVVGGSTASVAVFQTLCVAETVTGVDADGRAATRSLPVSRFSVPLTVPAGLSSVGARCPKGQSPLSTSLSIPAASDVRQVASPYAPDGSAGATTDNRGSPAKGRLFLSCLPGAIVATKGEAVVDTVSGPLVITVGP